MQHHQLSPDDWQSLERDPEFRALIRSRRRFIVPATIFFTLYYFALPVAAGFDRALMSRPVAGALSLGYAFAISQFFVAWVLLALYLYRARSFDAAVDRIAAGARARFP